MISHARALVIPAFRTSPRRSGSAHSETSNPGERTPASRPGRPMVIYMGFRISAGGVQL
jgi:hypothetical protein